MLFHINKNILLEEAAVSKQDQKDSGPGVGTAVGLGAGALALKTGAAVKAAPLIIKAGSSGGAIATPNDDWKTGAINSGVASGLGTAAIGGIGMAIGSGVPVGAIGVLSGAAATKGAVMGGLMSGGRDTLAKSVLIPAATVAATSPITNAALEAAGYDDVNVDPVVGAGITGLVNGIGWYARNHDNKKKQYV